MIENNSNSKKVFLSVLGVAILLVAVVGISYAAFTFENVGGANSVSTGVITMSYSEPVAGINISNALPIYDSEGYALTGSGNVFEFNISASATGSTGIRIPYTITVTPNNTGDGPFLSANQVHIALFTQANPTSNPVVDTTLDQLTGTSTKTLYSSSFSGLKDGTVSTDSYVLKMWVDEDVDTSDDSKSDNKIDIDKSYSYSLLVNVNANSTSLPQAS